jgi:hypothetical protein
VCYLGFWLHTLPAQRATLHQLQQQKACSSCYEGTECGCGVRELGLWLHTLPAQRATHHQQQQHEQQEVIRVKRAESLAVACASLACGFTC